MRFIITIIVACVLALATATADYADYVHEAGKYHGPGSQYNQDQPKQSDYADYVHEAGQYHGPGSQYNQDHPKQSGPFSVATPPFGDFNWDQRLTVWLKDEVGLNEPGKHLESSIFRQKEPPEIMWGVHVADGRKCVIIMVSPDGPTPYTLLWLQSDFVLSNDNHKFSPLNNAAPLRAYRAPDPPKGEKDKQEYRYTFLLFEQPADFKIPPKFAPWAGSAATERRNFDFKAFVTETGLQQPIAANYFFVSK